MPGTSYDVVLFGGLAVVLACLLQGKLNTLMVLAAGRCTELPHFFAWGPQKQQKCSMGASEAAEVQYAGVTHSPL